MTPTIRAFRVRNPVSGGSLAFERRDGASPVLLFVHGNSSNRGVWQPLIERLPGRAFLNLDLRGHGGSDRVRPPAYATADYASDVAAAAGTLNGAEFVLVGHSNGALTCLHHAAYGRPRPKALVYLDVDPRVPEQQVTYFRHRAGVVSRTFASLADLAKSMRAIDPAVPEPVFGRYLAGLARPVGGGVQLGFDPETYSSWEPADLWPALSQLDCPLLVLRAADSIVMSEKAALRMIDLAPRASLKVIEAAGHYLNLGKPAEVAAAIEAFLGEYGI